MKNIFLIILSIISVFGLWLLWLSFTFVTSFNSVCLSYRLNPTIDHSKNLDNFAQCLDSIPDKHNNLDYRCHLPHNNCSVNFSYSCNDGCIFVKWIRFYNEDSKKSSHYLFEVDLFKLIEIEDEFNALLDENIPSGVRRFYPDIIVTTNSIIWEKCRYYVLIALLLFPAYLIYREISSRIRITKT